MIFSGSCSKLYFSGKPSSLDYNQGCSSADPPPCYRPLGMFLFYPWFACSPIWGPVSSCIHQLPLTADSSHPSKGL